LRGSGNEEKVSNKTSLEIQSGETYFAAFCASLALLAGSGNNAGCNDGKNGGLSIRYARMSLG